MQIPFLIAPFEHFQDWNIWVGFALTLLIIGVLDMIVFYLLKRVFCRIYIVIGEILVLVGWLFDLPIVMYSSIAATVIGTVLFFTANLTECRNLIANNLKGKQLGFLFKHRRRKDGEALFDRDLVYGKVETAVITMAKQKIGAIISFEKKDSLNDIMKSGTMINAPVSAELLMTIFYPGTRLHDGAVIIRNDQIVAASVYYTPTTRPLTGKYGSRHRAAIGVSEICDAVTVVVSEETGRISIAYKGELQTVGPDAFLSTFEDLMLQVETLD